MIGNKAIFKQKYFLLYEILYINTFSVTEMNKNQKKKEKNSRYIDIDIGYRFEVTKNSKRLYTNGNIRTKYIYSKRKSNICNYSFTFFRRK